MSHSERISLAKNVLLTPEDTQKIDSRMAVPLRDIMENAGLMIARTLRQHIAPCRVVVACGPGNNGGDGYVVARYLRAWGWPVSVAPWAPPKDGTLAADVARAWSGPIVAFTAEEAQRADLVVDAVFGAGLSRPLPESVTQFFQQAQKCVAIDVPSGIDGAKGECAQDVPQAFLTVALERKRPAHLLSPAAEKCGRIVCVSIGIPQESYREVDSRFWENEPRLWPLAQQKMHDHKYSRGVVSVCAGAHMPGAARFASEGARHAGAGLVRVSAHDAVRSFYRHALPGCVVDDGPLQESVTDARRRVWVCGPGLTADEVAHALPILLTAGRCVVADAGALSWAKGNPQYLKGVHIMTPHLGEFTALFGAPAPSRVEAVVKAAMQTGAVMVLKGADTIIAAPDGRVAINRHATPALATAGSGDVLAGIIATLYASGMPAWEASCAGVWIHGDAGRCAAEGKGGWIVAEDMFAFIGKARHHAEMAAEEGK